VVIAVGQQRRARKHEKTVPKRGDGRPVSAWRAHFFEVKAMDTSNCAGPQRYAPGQHPNSTRHRFGPGNKAAAGRKKKETPVEPLDVRADMTWVYLNMAAKRPTRPPSSGALAMMQYAQRNPCQFLKQFIKLFEKPDDEPEDKGEEPDGGMDAAEFIRRWQERRGKEEPERPITMPPNGQAAPVLTPPHPSAVPVKPLPSPAPPPAPAAKKLVLCPYCQKNGAQEGCGACWLLRRDAQAAAGDREGSRG
jgi:hypothetical protein